METAQILIFAGSLNVALSPPIAALFWPLPVDAFISITQTFFPFFARLYASGVPMLPAPIMRIS